MLKTDELVVNDKVVDRPEHPQKADIFACLDRIDFAFGDESIKNETSKIRNILSGLECHDHSAKNLIDTVLQLSASTLPAETLELVLCEAARLTNADRAFVVLYSIHMDAYDRVESFTLKQFDVCEIEPTNFLASHVFETDNMLIANNQASNPAMPSIPGLDYVASTSILIVPLSFQMEGNKERMGALYVDSLTPGYEFTENNIDLLQAFASLATLSIRNTRLSSKLRLAYQDTVYALIRALEAKDEMTRGHSERVAQYSERCGKRYDLGMQRLEVLHSAALLHDIGKIGIRDDVLKKPGKLTSDEYAHIKSHPEISETILMGLDFLTEEMNILKQHHERYDGKGYPRGLKGDEISLEGYIIQVADAWDAMTAKRVYSDKKSVDDAVAELRRNSGTQFHPEVVEVFAGVIDDEGLIVLDREF
jgi:HD-GYP domain-containing protein (c-di-GMP phosphodiesterase class II)